MCPESSTPRTEGNEELVINSFILLLDNLNDSHRSPTAVSLTVTEVGNRFRFVVKDKSDSMLADKVQSLPEWVTQLSKLSAILSPSIILNPLCVVSINKHRSPSPSSAAPTRIPDSRRGS